MNLLPEEFFKHGLCPCLWQGRSLTGSLFVRCFAPSPPASSQSNCIGIFNLYTKKKKINHHEGSVFKSSLSLILACLILGLIPQKGTAQGNDVIFGKNKVQFGDDLNEWSIYETGQAICYYYGKSKKPAEFLTSLIQTEINTTQQLFEYHLKDKIELFVYADRSDFLQTNLDWRKNDQTLLTEFDQIFVQGTQVVIYFDGRESWLQKSLRKAIIQVYFNSMFEGSGLQEVVQKIISYKLPDWFQVGLVHYMSDAWGSSDLVQLKKVWDGKKKFETIAGRHNELIGKSFWYFIEQEYGSKSISNFLYLTRIHKDMNRAAKLGFGISLHQLFKHWAAFYSAQLQALAFETQPKKWIKVKEFQEFKKAFGTEEELVFSSEQQSKLRLGKIKGKKLHSFFRNGTRSWTYVKENHYPFYSKLGSREWILFEKRNRLVLSILEKGKPILKDQLPEDIIAVYDAHAYSDKEIILIASVKGLVDLLVYNIENRQYKKITDDRSEELFCFGIKANEFYFISNRSDRESSSVSDSFYVYHPYSIFRAVDLGNQWQINKLTTLESSQNIAHFFSQKDTLLYIISEQNNYKLKSWNPRESKEFLLIEEPQLIYQEGGQIFVLFKTKKRNRISIQFIEDQTETDELKNTKIDNENKLKTDSLQMESRVQVPIDTRFGSSKNRDVILEELFDSKTSKQNQTKTIHKPVLDSLRIIPFLSSHAIAYRRRFYVEDISTDFNNEILFEGLNLVRRENSAYDNPLPGLLLKIKLSEIFQNEHLEFGYRLPTNLIGSEAYLNLSLLKHRIDHTLSIYRRKDKQFDSNRFGVIKNNYNTVLLSHKMSYPFDAYKSFRFWTILRNDHQYFELTNSSVLDTSATFISRLAFRAEFVLDNSFQKSINIKEGVQAKWFAEVSKRTLANDDFSDIQLKKGVLAVLGMDLRAHYPVLRKSALSMRLAMASSFGSERIQYHLGGTQNWLLPSYSNEAGISSSAVYSYQALATEVRGYEYGSRKGGSYLVGSVELRIPFLQYILLNNWKNSFLRNLQFIAFADYGTAWDGLSPRFGNIETVRATRSNPVVTVDLSYKRNAGISGAGVGLRTALFGYFVRFDYARKLLIDQGNTKPVFHFSLGLDF